MARNFNLFEIKPEVEKLKAFRKNFVDSLSEPIVYKAICNKMGWFYTKGIYDVSKELKNRAFFDFNLVPLEINSKLLDLFIFYGLTDTRYFKAIRHNGKDTFLFTNSELVKQGKRYIVNPVFPVNEDLFNLCMINGRNFSSLTCDDISRYSEFFKVSDVPYLSVSESRLEDLYRTRTLTITEYKNIIQNFEIEEKAVKTLRK